VQTRNIVTEEFDASTEASYIFLQAADPASQPAQRWQQLATPLSAPNPTPKFPAMLAMAVRAMIDQPAQIEPETWVFPVLCSAPRIEQGSACCTNLFWHNEH